MKKKFNFQKFFCAVSFGFILTCILWYGGRFIYLYLENNKKIEETYSVVTLANKFKDGYFNTENLKQVKEDYYFNGSDLNNYVLYSNMLWRAVKINKDSSIVLVTDNVVGTLAYGDTSIPYVESNINKWLNIDKFVSVLTEREKYLVNTDVCVDAFSDIGNSSCDIKENINYLGLLSVYDYLNIGGSTSFFNNGKYSYLSNKTDESNIWYITDGGKLDNTDGSEILGIRPTVTLKPNIELLGGAGTLDDPYYFTSNIEFIGSYVKLDNDIWRVYGESNGIASLVLNNTIMDGENDLIYIYSNDSSYHDDTIKGSLAYYLNHDFYNSLSYKDIIVENTYSNGTYDISNNYSYNEIDTKTINTKVAIPSLSNIIFDDNSKSYFTSTGKENNSEAIYIQNIGGISSSKLVTSKTGVKPCISINKDKLVTGSGTSTDPYGVVN